MTATTLPHEIVASGNRDHARYDTGRDAVRWCRFLACIGIRPGNGHKVVPGAELRRWYAAWNLLLRDSEAGDRPLRMTEAARLTELAAHAERGWLVIHDRRSCVMTNLDQVAELALAHPGVTRIVPIAEAA